MSAGWWERPAQVHLMNLSLNLSSLSSISDPAREYGKAQRRPEQLMWFIIGTGE